MMPRLSLLQLSLDNHNFKPVMPSQQTTPISQIDEVLRQVLCGNMPEWAFPSEENFINAFSERVGFHGVYGLLDQQLERHGQVCDWPEAVRGRIKKGVMESAVWELRHRDVLKQVIASMECSATKGLLFKGTALAYSLYETPTLRSRGDTDLLVALEKKATLVSLLEEQGFEYSESPGDLLASQGLLELDCASGGAQLVDLHWQVNNSRVLSRLFDVDDLIKNAIPLELPCGACLRMDNVNALLLAAIHASNHRYSPFIYGNKRYFSGTRLIWLFDIHLLANTLNETEWHRLSELALEKGVGKIMLEYLTLCEAKLNTIIPEAVKERLRQCEARGVESYLQASPIRRKWRNVLAQENWQDRLRYLQQVFFPPAEFILERHASDRFRWLPWLYLKHGAAGVFARIPGRQKTN